MKRVGDIVEEKEVRAVCVCISPIQGGCQKGDDEIMRMKTDGVLFVSADWTFYYIFAERFVLPKIMKRKNK